MKLNFLPLVAILSFLTLAIAGCNDRRNDNTSSMTEAELLSAAGRLDSLFLEAFNKGDVNALMQSYWNNPELTVYPPARGMQLKGYEAVKEYYANDFTANKGAKLEYTSNKNIPFKDVLVGHGTFKWTLPVPGREPVVFEARHTIVKAMKGGKLVIILDHTSAPMMNESSGGTASTN